MKVYYFTIIAAKTILLFLFLTWQPGNAQFKQFQTNRQPLKSMINPDGTLQLDTGISGSFNTDISENSNSAMPLG